MDFFNFLVDKFDILYYNYHIMKKLNDFTIYTDGAELTFDVFGSRCKSGLKFRVLRIEIQDMEPKLQALWLKIRGMRLKLQAVRPKFQTVRMKFQALWLKLQVLRLKFQALRLKIPGVQQRFHAVRLKSWLSGQIFGLYGQNRGCAAIIFQMSREFFICIGNRTLEDRIFQLAVKI